MMILNPESWTRNQIEHRYSLGGMLSQIFMLSLGEALLKERIPTRNVRMLAFGASMDDGTMTSAPVHRI